MCPSSGPIGRPRNECATGSQAVPTHAVAVLVDGEAVGESPHSPIEPTAVRVDDLFSAGTRVAFHVTQTGQPLSDNAEVELGIAGLLTVGEKSAMTGHLVRDRLGASRLSAPHAERSVP